MNEEELKALVSRVTASVIAEVNRAEVQRGISVSQFRDQVRELGGGNLNSAWSISYSTSGIALDNPQLNNPIR
jgi:hypothetical protein